MTILKDTTKHLKLLPSSEAEFCRSDEAQPEHIIAAMLLRSEDGLQRNEQLLPESGFAGDHAQRDSVRSALTWRNGSNSIPRLSVDRAKELVNQILTADDDDQAAALVELITGIAYDPEAIDRDSLGTFATREAFIQTQEFSNDMESFATRAAARGTAAAIDQLPAPRVSERGEAVAKEAGRCCAETGVTLKRAIQVFEEEMVSHALRCTNGRSHAAALLNVSPDSLARIVRRHGARRLQKGTDGGHRG